MPARATATKRTTRKPKTAAAVNPAQPTPAPATSKTEKKIVPPKVNIGALLEKAPLALTVLYQSYIVTLWSYWTLQTHTINKINASFLDVAHAVFSVFAGLSLDFVMIGTALRDDKKGIVHFLTLVGAWVASSAISFNYFEGDWLHITWSTMVFLFSWSLAEGRGTDITKELREQFKNLGN